MGTSAREGLLVDRAGAPLAEEDSGTVVLPGGTNVPYRAMAPDNAAALQRFYHRLSDRLAEQLPRTPSTRSSQNACSTHLGE
jgi:hypothetical protein